MRTAILAAINGAGDPDAARAAALHAHQRQHDAWLALVGDLLYTAGSEGGSHLTTAFQQGGADDLPDYDPDDDGLDALPAWIAAHQSDLAQGVQRHTGDMLDDALASALSGGAKAKPKPKPEQPKTLQTLIDVTNDLIDQWIGEGESEGEGDSSDFAGMLANIWTALGWNVGEYDAAQALSALSAASEVTRTWNAIGDSHTRPAHADADGQTVGLHEAFSVGGEDLMYPCDPSGSMQNTSGCRCGVSYDLGNYTGSVDTLESADL